MMTPYEEMMTSIADLLDKLAAGVAWNEKEISEIGKRVSKLEGE